MRLASRMRPEGRGKHNFPAGAAIYAASASQADVQTAIDSAASGDRVYIPAGTATWTSAVTITNKSLSLFGAGEGETIITGHTPSVSPLQFISTTVGGGGYWWRASGIEWYIQAAGSANGIISVNVNNCAGYPQTMIRIDHMTMHGDPLDGTSSGNRFIMVAAANGVVDHCTFNATTTRCAGNVSASRDSPISTSNSYHVPLVLGTGAALYMENCTWDFAWNLANLGNGATDNYAGTRYVVRRCAIYNNNVGNHGWDTQARGVPSFEIYQNTFHAESGCGSINMFQPRSGTGVVWGNTIKNHEAVNNGYTSLLNPVYYAAIAPAELAGNAWLNTRATGYYPSGTWGALPYPGTTSVTDGQGNKVTGTNPIDGNQYGPDSMDMEYTRTVTDLVTTEGSTTITSASAAFVSGDLVKRLYATNITRGRTVADGVTTSGSSTLTSATANFGPGDVGRLIGGAGYTHLAQTTLISAVVNATTVTLSKNANASGTGLVLFLPDSHIVSITNSTTAVLSTPATASGTGGTLTIGHTNQGYPLADQPGRGAFPSANPGNWPNETSYTESEYQELAPIYCFENHWQEINTAGDVLSDTNPPAATVRFAGSTAYIKHLREWYDDGDVDSGTFAELPATCAVNDAFWVTDRGGHWDTTSGNANDGALYRCFTTNVWTLWYVPYTYPHPLTLE